MSAVLFLDLEETVIDHWNSRTLLMKELHFIKQAIEFRNANHEQPFVELGLFSYAVDNDKDLAVFEEELRKPIEDILGLKFNPKYLLTIETIKKLYTNATGLVFIEYTDFRDFCGDKAFTFFRIAPVVLEDSVKAAFLIDDLVGEMDLVRIIPGVTISTRNIVPVIKTERTDGKIIFSGERSLKIFM